MSVFCQIFDFLLRAIGELLLQASPIFFKKKRPETPFWRGSVRVIVDCLPSKYTMEIVATIVSGHRSGLFWRPAWADRQLSVWSRGRDNDVRRN